MSLRQAGFEKETETNQEMLLYSFSELLVLLRFCHLAQNCQEQ